MHLPSHPPRLLIFLKFFGADNGSQWLDPSLQHRFESQSLSANASAMHIFIDESGTFAIPEGGQSSPCLIGALIVPDFRLDHLLGKYHSRRQNLPQQNGEVKGRLLVEHQVEKVVDLLRKNNCLYVAIVIDMGFETPDVIRNHRENAARGLTANLTDEHHPELVQSVWQLRAELEAMPDPLYVQYTLMTQLLADVVQEIPAYWSQRRMKEILTFHWVVDGKGTDKVTKSEEWWQTTKTAHLQSKLAREPVCFPDWIDFSEFDKKFRMKMPDYLKNTILPYEDGFDLNLLFNESFRFSSSNDYGLELADIVVNATRRALKGNLGEEGWGQIPRLMIHRRDPYLKFRTLNQDGVFEKLPYADLIKTNFATGGRNMLI